MTTAPRTARGEATKRKLLSAAEDVFSELGYHAASITRITERAGVGQGTYYLYFGSKLDLFTDLVDDLSSRVRRAMSEAAPEGADRLTVERCGFRAFFDFAAEHPALYRVVREAEFVAPKAHRRHYASIAAGYEHGLRAAQAAGEVSPTLDPTVVAWALMGVGELVGRRFVLWTDDPTPIDDATFDHLMHLVESALTHELEPR